MFLKSLCYLILISLNLNANELKCFNNKCETKEKISFMGYKLYDINYCLTKKEEKIKLEYDIKISKEKNKNKLIEKFTENNKLTEEDKQKLNQWAEKTIDSTPGTTYEVIVNEEKSELKINNKTILSFNDKGDFGKKFIKIWCGENPVDEGLKDRIINARKTI